MKIDVALLRDARYIRKNAEEFEEIGFDGAYTLEGQNDPFIGTAAAATATSRMELMTSIAVAFARNPMNLAHLGNDLQLLSEGRFILGLGSQIKPHIEHRFCMPWGKPAARMRDMVKAIRAIWHCWDSGDKLDYRGEFYHHTIMAPTFTPEIHPTGLPPIYIAGVGPKMTEVAAEVGDGYFLHPFGSTKSFDEVTKPALQRGLDTAGKSLDDFVVAGQVMTATGLNDQQIEEALFSVRNQIGFYGSTPAYRPMIEVHGWGHMQETWRQMTKEGKWFEMAESVTDEMVEALAVVGTPEEIAKKIVARCDGRIDRISPVIYQTDPEVMRAVYVALKNEIKGG